MGMQDPSEDMMAAAREAQRSIMEASATGKSFASMGAGPRSWATDNDSDTDSSDADSSDDDDFSSLIGTQHGSTVRTTPPLQEPRTVRLGKYCQSTSQAPAELLHSPWMHQ